MGNHLKIQAEIPKRNESECALNYHHQVVVPVIFHTP